MTNGNGSSGSGTAINVNLSSMDGIRAFLARDDVPKETKTELLQMVAVGDNLRLEVRIGVLTELGKLSEADGAGVAMELASNVSNGRRGYEDRKNAFRILCGVLDRDNARGLVLDTLTEAKQADEAAKRKTAVQTLFGIMSLDTSCSIDERADALGMLGAVSQTALADAKRKLGLATMSDKLSPHERVGAFDVLVRVEPEMEPAKLLAGRITDAGCKFDSRVNGLETLLEFHGAEPKSQALAKAGDELLAGLGDDKDRIGAHGTFLAQVAADPACSIPLRVMSFELAGRISMEHAEQAAVALCTIAADDDCQITARATAIAVLREAAPGAATQAEEQVKAGALDDALTKNQRMTRMALLKGVLDAKAFRDFVLDEKLSVAKGAEALAMLRQMMPPAAFKDFVLNDKKLESGRKAMLVVELNTVHPEVGGEMVRLIKAEALNKMVSLSKRVQSVRLLRDAVPKAAGEVLAKAKKDILDDNLTAAVRAGEQTFLAKASKVAGLGMEGRLLALVNDPTAPYVKRASAVEVLFELHGEDARGKLLCIVNAKETPKKREVDNSPEYLEALKRFCMGVMGMDSGSVSQVVEELKGAIVPPADTPKKPSEALEGLFTELAMDVLCPLRLRVAAVEMLGELSPPKKSALLRGLENVVDEAECLPVERENALVILVETGGDDALSRLVAIGQDDDDLVSQNGDENCNYNRKLVCETIEAVCRKGLLGKGSGYERLLIERVLSKLDNGKGEETFRSYASAALHTPVMAGTQTLPSRYLEAVNLDEEEMVSEHRRIVKLALKAAKPKEAGRTGLMISEHNPVRRRVQGATV